MVASGACTSSSSFSCSLWAGGDEAARKHKPLPDLSVRQGQMGDGSSPSSLSRASIWRTLFSGCWFPDAILHGKRSYRPRSRAVRRLSAMRISSEAFQLASAGGCATGLRTRSRHACDFFVRVLTTGSGSATAYGGAFALSHGSRLFSLKLPFISQSSGVVINIAGTWKFFTEPAEFQCSSRCVRSFCPPFGVFRLADRVFARPPESSVRADAQ